MKHYKLKKLRKLKIGQEFLFISGDGLARVKLGDVPSSDEEATYTVYENAGKPGTGIKVSTNNATVVWLKGT